MRRQQQALPPAFLSRLSGGNCRVVRRAFVAARRSWQSPSVENYRAKEQSAFPLLLKKKELPNNRGIQMEMKPTQKETVYLTMSLSWEGNVNRNPKGKKKEKEKGRKSTQAAIAHSSNIWQQIIMPSLQLINSHLVIDINKGRVVFISRLSQAGPLFFLPWKH